MKHQAIDFAAIWLHQFWPHAPMEISEQGSSFQVDTLDKMEEEKALPQAHNISTVNGAGCFFHSILLLIQCLKLILCLESCPLGMLEDQS